MRDPKKLARQMREIHGVEMTPDQVVEVRKSALQKIRAHLWDLNPPADDDELVMWLARLTKILRASERT